MKSLSIYTQPKTINNMNNDNTVKIGVALKWRNTFDTTKRYYQENVVTACGCVFRCKVLQAQGKSPIKFTDEQGHIAYTNTDIWDVLVDMAYYYNYAVDTRKLTKEMLDFAKKLDEAFQKQQKEIKALQDENQDQWSHIEAIETHNAEQQREIDSLHDTISCFSEGIWVDTLLWSNLTIWDNNKYAITDDLQDQINELTDHHRQDIKDLTDKHNSELSALTSNIVKQNKIQDGINDYFQDQIYGLNNALCCFGSGIWENDLHWSLEALWDNNKFAITDALSEELKSLTETHRKDVDSINNHLKTSDKTFADAVLKNTQDHRLVNEHLQRHDAEIESLQALIEEHDQQIIDLLETLTCYSYGQWDNGLKWGEVSLWENSNQMCDTFDDVYNKIANHQKSIEELAKKISEIKLESPTAQIEALREEMIAENRKTAYQIRAIGRDQLAQDTDIAKIGEHFSCYADGIWGDLFIWDNDLKWANQTGVINEAIADIRSDISIINQQIIDANEDIMTNLALIRTDHQLIEGNMDAIAKNKAAIASIQEKHDDDIKALRYEALAEHRQVAYQLRAIGREQSSQNDEIAKLGEHFNCFADGVWCNLFLWDNDRLWSNTPGVMIRALEDIHEELDLHQNTLNDIIEEKNEHFSCFHDDVWCNSSFWRNDHLWPFDIADIVSAFEKQDEEIQSIQKSAKEIHSQIAVEIGKIEKSISDVKDDISGIKTEIKSHSSLIQENQERIKTHSEDIAKNASDIHKLNNDLKLQSEEFHNELLTEHRQVAYQLRALNREQIAQDENVAQIGSHFNCFADGLWGNHFLWDNGRLWANEPGVVESAFDDVNIELAVHQEALDSILNEQSEHFDCYGDDVWCNSSVWKNDRMWPGDACVDYSLAIQKLEGQTETLSKSLKVLETQSTREFYHINDDLQTTNQKISEVAAKVTEDIQHLDSDINDVKEAIESVKDEALMEHRQVAYQLRAIGREQAVQDDKIAKLGEHFGCFVDGIWCDLFLWDNDHLWSNEVGVVKGRLDTLDTEVAELYDTLAQVIEETESHFDCISDGVWHNMSYWNEVSYWKNGENELGELYDLHRSDFNKISKSVGTLSSDINKLSTAIEEHKLLHKSDIASIVQAVQANAENIEKNKKNLETKYLDACTQIDTLQKDNTESHRQIAYQIRAINRDQAYQDEQISKIGDHFGCFVDGQWGDLFLWHNDHLWHNATGVIEEAIADIHIELDDIQKNLSKTMEEASEHFDCIGEGIWCNSSIWLEDSYWKNGKNEIGELYAEHRKDTESLKTQIGKLDEASKTQASLISSQTSVHTKDISTLRQEISKQNEANAAKFSSIQETLDSHQSKIDDAWAEGSCIDGGVWNNTYFWNDKEIWHNKGLRQIEEEVANHESRLASLEKQFAAFFKQYSAQQTIIQQQQDQLGALMDCFSVLNVGKWQNLLLWDNTSKWTNVIITEAAVDGGVASVRVKDYDSASQTVSF